MYKTKTTIMIPNNVVEMAAGFMIVRAPVTGRNQYAAKLADAFASGALAFADVDELGSVGIVSKHSAEELGDEMSTGDHLSNFVSTWDEEIDDQFVEPNSLIVIDWIDTFTPEGDDTFDEIQAWAEKHKSRVIGILRA